MKKIVVFLLLIVIASILGGLYGILHDQLTYSISHEYYTKFKFYQFELKQSGDEAIFPNPRFQVSIVGFLATWWMGLPIGIILGCVGFIHPTAKLMWIVTLRAMALTIFVAFVTGLIGLLYGKLYLADVGVNWYLPKNLIDTNNFIAVGSMHNYSYLGGLCGLIASIFYSVKQRKKGKL